MMAELNLISADPSMMFRAADLYHWACDNPCTSRDDCEGAATCPWALDVDMNAVAELVKATEHHMIHQFQAIIEPLKPTGG
jgi:hypothetical protein